MKNFHNNEFDDSTLMKLDIFRKYVREWLPVFMKNGEKIAIYDFFSGPGKDARGNPGSPLILMEELAQFCETYPDTIGKNTVQIFYNDIENQNIEMLKQVTQESKCSHNCCTFEFYSKDFKQLFSEVEKDITQSKAPSLIILDQFGVSDVTPEILSKLAQSRRTDIIFFIPSSYIYRFPDTLGSKIGLNADEEDLEYKVIHRYICEHFKSKLSGHLKYYLAPFSIKKKSNIYGVIFGTSNLYGLEKFLTICWDIAPENGTANYNISNDPAYHGEQFLFDDMNRLTKEGKFKEDLLEYLGNEKQTNRDVYCFCLENGFSVTKANKIIRELSNDKKINIINISDNKPARRGSFYLGYKNYKQQAKVYYQRSQ